LIEQMGVAINDHGRLDCCSEFVNRTEKRRGYFSRAIASFTSDISECSATLSEVVR
jgi:hypothetical protein